MLSLLKFCHSRSVAAYSHFPFSLLHSPRYRRHMRSTRKKITRCRRGGESMREAARYRYRIIEHRPSAMRSQSVPSRRSIVSRLPNHPLHCESPIVESLSTSGSCSSFGVAFQICVRSARILKYLGLFAVHFKKVMTN